MYKEIIVDAVRSKIQMFNTKLKTTVSLHRSPHVLSSVLSSVVFLCSIENDSIHLPDISSLTNYSLFANPRCQKALLPLHCNCFEVAVFVNSKSVCFLHSLPLCSTKTALKGFLTLIHKCFWPFSPPPPPSFCKLLSLSSPKHKR